MDEQEMLQRYADGVDRVEDAEGFVRLLATCVDAPFRPWGLGVDPDELGRMLWDLRGTLATARSLLHVGTGHGLAYYAIRGFARRCNPDIACHTRDKHNCVVGAVLPHICHDRIMEAYFGDSHDVVVLSGRQGLVDFLAEYNHVGLPARVCLVLDVHGAWWWESFRSRRTVRQYGSNAVLV